MTIRLFTTCLLMIPFICFGQQYNFEYHYYSAYGKLDKKVYNLLKKYTQKEFERKPSSEEIAKTCHQVNEAFAHFGILAFSQRGDQLEVKKRLKSIELAVRRFGPYFEMEDVQQCFLEVVGTDVKRRSRKTKQLVYFQYQKKIESLAID